MYAGVLLYFSDEQSVLLAALLTTGSGRQDVLGSLRIGRNLPSARSCVCCTALGNNRCCWLCRFWGNVWCFRRGRLRSVLGRKHFGNARSEERRVGKECRCW